MIIEFLESRVKDACLCFMFKLANISSYIYAKIFSISLLFLICIKHLTCKDLCFFLFFAGLTNASFAGWFLFTLKRKIGVPGLRVLPFLFVLYFVICHVLDYD